METSSSPENERKALNAKCKISLLGGEHVNKIEILEEKVRTGKLRHEEVLAIKKYFVHDWAWTKQKPVRKEEKIERKVAIVKGLYEGILKPKIDERKRPIPDEYEFSEEGWKAAIKKYVEEMAEK